MKHHRMGKYSCGEQALAVDVLRSAVQEIKDRLHHVRSATTLAAKHDHLLAIAKEWRLCVRYNHWHELTGIDPNAMADKLRDLVSVLEYEQIVVAYRLGKIGKPVKGKDEASRD